MANANPGDGLEERLYAIQDANFNVTAVVDKNGDVVERYRYSPYGQRTVLTPAFALDADGLSDVAWQVGHQGLMHDAETGLVYNRARMRHAKLGRGLQRDPLGYVDGMSLLQFVKSSPAVRLDSTGRDSFSDGFRGRDLRGHFPPGSPGRAGTQEVFDVGVDARNRYRGQRD